jgi:hypothetical protein
MKRTRFILFVGGLMAAIFVIMGCTTDRDRFLTTEQLLTGEGPGQTLSSDFGSAEPQFKSFDKNDKEKLAEEKEWTEKVYSLLK